MNVTELEDWNSLTPQEQERLKDIYNVDADGNLPETITQTMAQESPEKPKDGGSDV